MKKRSLAGLVGSKRNTLSEKPELAVDVSSLSSEVATIPTKQSERRRGGTQPIQPSRVGKQLVGSFFEKNVKKQFVMLALEEEKNQSELLTEAINDLFKKYNKPPIA